MASDTEITATEKLLELIRNEESSGAQQQDSSPVNDLTAPDSEHKTSETANSQVEPSGIEFSPQQIQPPNSEKPSVSSEEDANKTQKSPKTLVSDVPGTTENYSKVQQIDSEESNWTWYSPEQKYNSALSSITNFFRRTKIGIDIQPGSLHCIKTNITNTKRSLLACESTSFDYVHDEKEPPDIYENPSLKGILSQKLASFTKGELRKPEIWCSYAFCNPVAIYNVTLPKVPAKDIPQAVFWSLKKEVDFDETKTIFDYTIFKEVEVKGHIKLQSIVTLIPKKEARSITNLFDELGYPLTGLTFPAAAIQNFLKINHSAPDSGPVVYFTIRNQNSFIDLFYQGKMLFSREIKTGVESFVESIMEQASKRDILLDDKSAKNYIFNIYEGNNARKNPKIDETISNMLELHSLPVIERLIRQLLRTFEYCTTNFKIPAVEKLYTAGTTVLNDEMLANIQKQLNMPCSIIMPFDTDIFSFATPPRLNPQYNILPATGLALSDKCTTQNFLHTYVERALEKSSKKINTIIASASICLAVTLGILFAIQYNDVTDKRSQLNGLENDLNQQYSLDPRTRTPEYLHKAIAQIKHSQAQSIHSIDRFQILGIIQEITQNLPREAKLTNLSFKLPQDFQKDSLDQSSKNPDTESVFLTGIISATDSRQDFILLSILKRLSGLKFTTDPILESSSKNRVSEEATELKFKIRMALAQHIKSEGI